jgi:hypothetical protein
MFRIRLIFAAAFAIIGLPVSPVYAGMPVPVLTEYGMERLIGISTAAFVVMVIAAIPMMFCWNALIGDGNGYFKRLNYPKALGITFLGGCFFVLILVMVAGSRELFSPGAWIPNGIVSKTAFDTERERIAKTAEQSYDLLRRDAVVKLRDTLRQFIQEHDRLPVSIEESKFGDLWLIPFAAGMQYEYFPQDHAAEPLVREPVILPDAKFSIGRTFEITEAAK